MNASIKVFYPTLDGTQHVGLLRSHGYLKTNVETAFASAAEILSHRQVLELNEIDDAQKYYCAHLSTHQLAL